ncbi:MAG: FAD-binding oxidoreductase [Cytophagales bacterium]|nr:MAG: FAD-binding oxidoreductase [Cytophagales bacterium]
MKNLISFWEKESFLQFDVVIVGGGLVGLSTACELIEREKNIKIAILERGILPTGASTKNAGFACFGSPSELLSDAKNYGWEYVLTFVEKRLRGLEKLEKRLGTKNIDLEKSYGGYEIIQPTQLYVIEQLNELNQILKKVPFFENLPNKNNIYQSITKENIKKFGFKNVNAMLHTPHEAQLHTGKMMKSLYLYAQKLGISIFTGADVNHFEQQNQKVIINTTQNITFTSNYLLITNNSFYQQFSNKNNIKAGRGQVLITKELEKNLSFMGNFHLEEGFYYFRNVGKNRVLLGGGRNLDFEKETSTDIEITDIIQNELEKKLKEIILPNQNFEIEMRWAGIMAFTDNHQPIIEKISENIGVAVALNGMGVAIGTKVGEELVNLFF